MFSRQVEVTITGKVYRTEKGFPVCREGGFGAMLKIEKND